jgi:hypothetical protein
MRHPKQSRLWHILPLVVATPWLIVVPVNAKAGASAERASSPASSGLHSVLPATTTDQIGSFTALADGLVKTPDGMTLTVAGQINAYGLAEYPSIYGGVVVSDKGAHITVYLTTLDSAAEKSLQSLAPAGSVSFLSTPHSQKFIETLQNEVNGEWTALLGKGIDVVGFGPAVQHGVLDIRVLNLSTTDTAILDNTFGATNIDVIGETATELPKLTSTTRIYDSSPYNGGDAITNDAGRGCSSGFGITISGTSYLLTAGHCFTVGTDIYNARYFPRHGYEGDNVLMGTLLERSFSNTTGTTAVINTRGSDLIWTGTIGSSQRAVVSGSTNNPVGDQVCQSGAYSGESCGIVIQGNNTCTTFTGVRLCHLIRAIKSTGGIATQTGDSGGPVFRFSGSSLLATGTDVAGASTKTKSYNRSCQYFITTATCSSEIWYTAISWTLTHWHASINT